MAKHGRKYRTVTVRVGADLVVRIDRAASQMKRSRSKQFEDALEKQLLAMEAEAGQAAAPCAAGEDTRR